MGVLVNLARFLAAPEVVSGRCLTLGHQNLYCDAADLEAVRPGLGAAAADPWADTLLRLLGAGSVDSLDAAAYEGATVVHDLNDPAPPGLWGRYDTVIDAGTLEHVFHLPNALTSCMRMLRVGGRLVVHTTANNACGHGFYQFSPELFFRVFSPENGFEVERCVLHEDYADAPWYEVADPARAGRRVELCNSLPAMLLVLARKVADKEPFARPPQQSDYVPLWGKTPAAAAARRPRRPVFPGVRRALGRALRPLRLWLYGRRVRRGRTLSDRRCYTPVRHTAPAAR